MTRILAIIGAGPKAAAIVARAAVLRDLAPNRDHPSLLVFDKVGPGSAWSGEAGYTSGFLTLCSPAEKDVGFPYGEIRASGTRSIAGELHRRFSWNAYLVASGDFAEWVDRGREPPSHRAWARYIRWVFEQAGQACAVAEVTRVARTGQGLWRLTSEVGGASTSQDVHGVVFTGTGDPRRVRTQGAIPPERIFDPADVWAARRRLLDGQEKVVAIVGDGGAAGAVAAWLAPRLAEQRSSIRSISPMGTLLPRGDGYGERRWFSDPTDWRELPEGHRRILLAHTEAGVISARNKAVIDASANIEFTVGRAEEVRAELDELILTVGYDRPSADGASLEHRTGAVSADFLINGMGFDPWSVLKIVRGKVQNLLGSSSSAEALRRRAEREIQEDLSLPASVDAPGGLHVPGLAALARGPGMPTLGCLGLVARAVLDSYIE